MDGVNRARIVQGNIRLVPDGIREAVMATSETPTEELPMRCKSILSQDFRRCTEPWRYTCELAPQR